MQINANDIRMPQTHSYHSNAFVDLHYFMPILKSAKKALRQNKKRRLLNLRRLRAMRQAIKAVQKSVESLSPEELQKLLSVAYKAIDKAAKRGVIKKNTAARKKSRLTKFVNRLRKQRKKSAPVTQSPQPTDQGPRSDQPSRS